MKKDVTPNAVEYVPISLARRAVLRSETLVNVEVMLAVHQMFKREQSLLNEMTATFDDGSIPYDSNIWRMALQTGAEERLKVKGQLFGVFLNDPGFEDGDAQDLFEQFYKEHGLPNAAEKALLSRVGGQSFETIDRFCKSKHSACLW